MGLPDKSLPKWKSIHTIVFDFDGVFTNNKVWVDQNGVESVCCDRSDGLGFDILRGFVEKNNWCLNYFILSKEKNPVVTSRAKKMQVQAVQSISDKAKYLTKYMKEKNLDRCGLIYLGNDLNDLAAMEVSGYSVAPLDSHPLIIKQADLVLQKKGGEGVVREFIELLIGLEKMPPNKVGELF
ncbi:MAG: HAD hydrolase family protein [Litorivicinaceae bacterium]|nr:HAD hydrolase family protein [Litorivicinaceae bacterium]